jgi:hypothetical protein
MFLFLFEGSFLPLRNGALKSDLVAGFFGSARGGLRDLRTFGLVALDGSGLRGGLTKGVFGDEIARVFVGALQAFHHSVRGDGLRGNRILRINFLATEILFGKLLVRDLPSELRLAGLRFRAGFRRQIFRGDVFLFFWHRNGLFDVRGDGRRNGLSLRQRRRGIADVVVFGES